MKSKPLLARSPSLSGVILKLTPTLKMMIDSCFISMYYLCLISLTVQPDLQRNYLNRHFIISKMKQSLYHRCCFRPPTEMQNMPKSSNIICTGPQGRSGGGGGGVGDSDLPNSVFQTNMLHRL